MKTFAFAARASITTIVFAFLFTGAASANCKVAGPGRLFASRMGSGAYSMRQQPLPAQRPDAGASSPTASPVGFWYVRFLSGGQLVDDGFDIWTSDGTEILNDTTPPVAGAVCLGVWSKTDAKTYSLKHPTWIFDDAGVNLVAIGIIREEVQLDQGGNSFSGSLTLDLYDLSGNQIDHETGSVTGTRINAVDDKNTPPSPIPGLPPSILNR